MVSLSLLSSSVLLLIADSACSCRFLRPFGWVKYRPSGLYFLQLQKWGIMQCVLFFIPLETRPSAQPPRSFFPLQIRLHSTCLNARRRRHQLHWSLLHRLLLTHLLACLGTISLSFPPSLPSSLVVDRVFLVQIAIAISVSVTIAMYCVLQLYVVVAKELKPFNPIMKFLCIKVGSFRATRRFPTGLTDGFHNTSSSSSPLSSSPFGKLRCLRFSRRTVLSRERSTWSVFLVVRQIHPPSFERPDVVPRSPTVQTAEDVLVGLNALLETFEMVM